MQINLALKQTLSLDKQRAENVLGYPNAQPSSIRSTSAMKMTTEEAFVKTLQMHGIEHAFGIIGSAFMPISDFFPTAGINFWD